MKRIALTLIAILIVAFPMFSQDSIVSIPDTAFLHALIDEGVDTNEDSLISYEEAEAVDGFGVQESGISDMTGIEAFTNLEFMDCSNNQLTSLDVSKNIRLGGDRSIYGLHCSHNQLTHLDVSNCIDLHVIDCSHNQLTNLDLSDNINLSGAYDWNLGLNVSYNQLSKLDISNCPKLRAFYANNMPSLNEVCVWNGFYSDTTRIHIVSTDSPNIYFTTECGANNVEIPDTAFLHALIDEGVDTNEDSLISYEEAEATTKFEAFGWPAVIGNIYDVTGIEAFINLDTLELDYNLISEIDLSNNTELIYLNIGDNQISNVDISNCTKLQYFNIDGDGFPGIGSTNQITKLDLSKNTALTYLSCGGNQLTSLDVSNNPKLIELYCNSTCLTSINLSNNVHLTNLSLAYPQCENDLPDYMNQITKLDISNNPKIIDLNLRYMRFLVHVCVWETFFVDSVDIDIDVTGLADGVFKTECTTAIEESSYSEFSIYPNPTNTHLTIEIEYSDHYSINITTLNGQQIFTGEMEGTSHQIDLSSFHKGVYFITIRSQDLVTTRKIIKL